MHGLDRKLCALEVCRKRFLRDPAMAAYVGFLQEKLPLGGVLLRRLDRETPLLPGARAWSYGGEKGPALIM